MYILAIETTGPQGSAAIINEEKEVSMKLSSQEMNHLKDLMPMTQHLVSEMGIKKSDISAVAASVGPGSFTGIRIGVSTARALAQTLEIPTVSVETLDTFKLKAAGTSADYIVPIFNARRGQVYGAVFNADGTDVLKSGPYMLTDVFDALTRQMDDDYEETCGDMPEVKTVVFYGDGIDAYEEELNAFFAQASSKAYACRFVLASKADRYQNAAMTAEVALEKFKAGETVNVDDLVPDYMRQAEAEQKLKDGSLARERAAKLAKFKAR